MGDDRFGVENPIRLAAPETAGMRAHLIGEPVWTTTFSPTAAATFFPSEAAVKGMTTGRGIAECTVEASGALKSCRPGSAEPEGAGFSEAAVKAACDMRMSPWTRDGGPVDGAIVRIPIRLTFAEPSAQNTAENAVFLGAPTSEDMLRVFPRRALARNVGGEVDLRCRVEAGGAVDRCAVTRELPGGWGFGSAAESLASKYRVSMQGHDHPQIGSWINVPVTMETMSH